MVQDDPNSAQYMDTVLEAVRANTIGRVLSFDNHPSQKPGLSGYEIGTYRDLVRNNVSNLNYCLPVRLALHMGGLNDPKVHMKAK